MSLDLETLKAHVNQTTDIDDALLDRLLAASQKHVESDLGYALDDEEELPNGVPDDLEQAALMVAAHWYANRETALVGVTATEIPIGAAAIISNHRTYSTPTDWFTSSIDFYLHWGAAE